MCEAVQGYIPRALPVPPKHKQPNARRPQNKRTRGILGTFHEKLEAVPDNSGSSALEHAPDSDDPKPEAKREMSPADEVDDSCELEESLEEQSLDAPLEEETRWQASPEDIGECDMPQEYSEQNYECSAPTEAPSEPAKAEYDSERPDTPPQDYSQFIEEVLGTKRRQSPESDQGSNAIEADDGAFGGTLTPKGMEADLWGDDHDAESTLRGKDLDKALQEAREALVEARKYVSSPWDPPKTVGPSIEDVDAERPSDPEGDELRRRIDKARKNLHMDPSLAAVDRSPRIDQDAVFQGPVFLNRADGDDNDDVGAREPDPPQVPLPDHLAALHARFGVAAAEARVSRQQQADREARKEEKRQRAAEQKKQEEDLVKAAKARKKCQENLRACQRAKSASRARDVEQREYEGVKKEVGAKFDERYLEFVSQRTAAEKAAKRVMIRNVLNSVLDAQQQRAERSEELAQDLQKRCESGDFGHAKSSVDCHRPKPGEKRRGRSVPVQSLPKITEPPVVNPKKAVSCANTSSVTKLPKILSQVDETRVKARMLCPEVFQ
eukprot:gnl/MRDRNA2_/MRDRNA2_86900_c0_seq1.p1 gnl/MRDRNA2_/MRDRNA2_86900_c0~~gnl/MRDRNA2_/MRDRNA2_86900_c0_seq1.p1  ORF type:complete len:552 (-),score=151.28 gnl/MRDRNA2_/MRDRNA2_86900_c0_seq1:96-1751(-)